VSASLRPASPKLSSPFGLRASGEGRAVRNLGSLDRWFAAQHTFSARLVTPRVGSSRTLLAGPQPDGAVESRRCCVLL
jgi:hypothetical protein